MIIDPDPSASPTRLSNVQAQLQGFPLAAFPGPPVAFLALPAVSLVPLAAFPGPPVAFPAWRVGVPLWNGSVPAPQADFSPPQADFSPPVSVEVDWCASQ